MLINLNESLSWRHRALGNKYLSQMGREEPTSMASFSFRTLLTLSRLYQRQVNKMRLRYIIIIQALDIYIYICI